MDKNSKESLVDKIEQYSTDPTQSIEFELLDNSEKLAPLHSLNPFPVIHFNSDTVVTAMNPAAMTIFGNSKGSSVYEVLPEFELKELQNCLNSNSLVSRICKVNSSTFQFIARGTPSKSYGLIYGVDISERLVVENKLEESYALLRKVIDTNPNLIFVKNSSGEFTLANQTVADLYGTTIDEIIGKTDCDFNNNNEEVESFRQDDMEVIRFERDLVINEESITDSSGNTRWLQTVKRPIRLHEEEVHVLGVATDVTQLKKLQSQLLHSQKMEALGQLAGGIAHDFNNLLTGILGGLSLLMQSNSNNEQVINLSQTIEKAALQASQLTQKLLGFAREGKHQNIPVDLHHTIHEVAHVLARTVEENIEVKLDLESSFSHVLGDPVQIQQIILNLALNARDAIMARTSSHGLLKISTEDYSVTSESDQSAPILKPGKYVRLEIIDNGCGIPSSHLARIFEPFFTTKEASRGTGMGLAMVYGIVENHGGLIDVTSTEGNGSTFTIYLPIIDHASTKSEKTVPSSIKGKGTILLVDDHRMIREVTSQMLDRLGYKVHTAHDGLEALEFYRKNFKSIDLVILDMVMPRLGARDCFRQIKEINPEVKVILSTGYVNNNKVHELVNDGMAGFVQKPYQLQELSEIVAGALQTSENRLEL